MVTVCLKLAFWTFGFQFSAFEKRVGQADVSEYR